MYRYEQEFVLGKASDHPFLPSPFALSKTNRIPSKGGDSFGEKNQNVAIIANCSPPLEAEVIGSKTVGFFSTELFPLEGVRGWKYPIMNFSFAKIHPLIPSRGKSSVHKNSFILEPIIPALEKGWCTPFFKTTFLLFLLSFFSQTNLTAQEPQKGDEDAFFIKKIYNTALTQGQCYDWLTHLTTRIGGRLAGSPQAAAAVEYTKQMLDTLNLDSVWLQPCMVPHWVRGEKEQVRIVNSNVIGSMDLNALALGNSIGTGTDGITAEVIEVQSLEEVEKLGAANIKGKIVFYNRPMDPTQLRTFSAYGGAVDQRGSGASMAAKYGAVAVLVRSMTTRLDDIPHTGGLGYKNGIKKIPAVAISTKDAEVLSRVLKKEKTHVFVRTMCEMLSDKLSYNVIGEIRGSEKPDEIILVGGHLDSWDVGSGAHDDGAGCVHAMDVLQILKRINYRPKRTIRCVLFMNEENGLAGGKAYANASNEKGEYHLAAIESDAGGFTPRGFSSTAHADVFKAKYKKMTEWLPLLEPYGLNFWTGGSGADINPLKSQKGLLIGFRPDSQRYFDYHHTAIDNIDAVNKRELELGAASITALLYLIDKYGL